MCRAHKTPILMPVGTAMLQQPEGLLMATHQIRVGEDCIAVLDRWRHERESMTDAIRRMNRHLREAEETGVKE